MRSAINHMVEELDRRSKVPAALAVGPGVTRSRGWRPAASEVLPVVSSLEARDGMPAGGRDVGVSEGYAALDQLLAKDGGR